ncbi:MAG TPA: Hsp20/alpha crystallin family protein [Methylomirabilota bacterium]|jgi:HSP20 family protein|nr:Hsp20/alpha crystallin family protein [Methylomirabilota bacterium]
MRYRRLGSRYTMIVAAGPLASISEFWHLPRLTPRLAEPRWRPETDVVETAEAITVTAAVAGIDPDTTDVLLFEDALVIEGRRFLRCDEDGVYRVAQIRQGPFRVEVSLPVAIDPEGVDVRYEQGLLTIRLPKLGGR